MNKCLLLVSLCAAVMLSGCSNQKTLDDSAQKPVISSPETKSGRTQTTQKTPVARTVVPPVAVTSPVQKLCREIGNKLSSVSVNACNAIGLQESGHWSAQQRTLAVKEFPATKDSLGKILVIGGIHGDEYASISITFKWMELLDQQRDGRLQWRFIPASNPDGLLRKKSQRQNANGVDLNRNFPSQDWERLALKYWRTKAYKNPRRFPGHRAASEPETLYLLDEIKTFQPDIIVAIHAPYHLLDYDGPSEAPERIGDLHLHELGVYPGSLGNYGGLDLQLPVITLELPSAGIMPKPAEVKHMWKDLNAWLINERNKQRGM